MAKQFTPFNERLAELRRAHRYSYRQLQEALEKEGIQITHTALRKWELGLGRNRIPGKAQIAALSRVFNVEPGFLLEEVLNVKPRGPGRVQQWQDVDLLSEQQHDLLLAIKREFLAQKIDKTKEGTNGHE